MNLLNVYIALAVLLITILALHISWQRVNLKIANGDGNNLTMKKAIRAHMNTLEHTLPYSLVLFVLHSQGVSEGYFAVLALSFLLLRVGHAFSMMGTIFPLRRFTAGLTYFLEVVACVTVLGNEVMR